MTKGGEYMLRTCVGLVGVMAIFVVSACGAEPVTDSGAPAAAPSPVGRGSLAGSAATTTATPEPAGLTSRSPDDRSTPTTLQPTTTIVSARGCTVLTAGMNGIKVKMVQRRLGLPDNAWETMDSATIEAVRRFQQQTGLAVDGVVGPHTWRALGFREDFCFDSYQALPALPLTAGVVERRGQMIAFAKLFIGEEYVWGGAGPRGYGVDCSGLVLQALYSAGLDPQPITVDKHVLPDYRTSRELYDHSRLNHVPLAAARRGDLVFWRSNETGQVNHVAIYLGDRKVLEAVEPRVRIGDLGARSTQTVMPQAVRPFPAKLLG